MGQCTSVGGRYKSLCERARRSKEMMKMKRGKREEKKDKKRRRNGRIDVSESIWQLSDLIFPFFLSFFLYFIFWECMFFFFGAVMTASGCRRCA